MILALNTSTAQFSMALMREDGSLVAESLIAPGSGRFRAFMPILHDLMASAGTDPVEIKALAVAKGPGSFSGLRVGLAAAKGICQGLGIPVVGVSSLEALAYQLPFASLPVCPLIDSRRGEVFTALFRWSGDQRMLRFREDA